MATATMMVFHGEMLGKSPAPPRRGGGKGRVSPLKPCLEKCYIFYLHTISTIYLSLLRTAVIGNGSGLS